MTIQAFERMDAINRRTWRTKAAVQRYRTAEGFTDLGERAAIGCVGREVKGQPILDLGVGGGRTVPILHALSSDYLALDYTPELVEACRDRYPQVRVALGDARDLSRFPSGSFKLVVFSYNGIDSVDRAGRLSILREVHRVLKPGGLFLFSAHNLEGRDFAMEETDQPPPTLNPVRWGVRLGRSLLHTARSKLNRLRYAKLDFESDDYAILNDVAEAHGIVVHYTSLAGQLRELATVGFQPDPIVFDNLEGRRINLGDDVSSAWWFHFVARK